MSAPNRLWVADISYLRTWEGWLYIAVVVDCYSRRVVGWSSADHLRADLVVDALERAVARRRPKPDSYITPTRFAIRVAGARAALPTRRDRALDRIPRLRLRQRRVRSVLQDLEERTR